MLVQEENPGIDFEYSMPSGAVKLPGDDRYDWSLGDWSACSGMFQLILSNTVNYKPLYLYKVLVMPIILFDFR